MEPTPEPDDPWQARGQARSWPVPGMPAPGQRQSDEDGDRTPAGDPATAPPDQPTGPAGPTGAHPQVSNDKAPPQDLFAPGRVNSALTGDTEMVALGSRRPADALLGGVTRWNNQAGFPAETNGHRNGDTGPRHGGAPIMNAPRSPFAPPADDLPPPASPLFAPSPFAPQAPHGSAPVGNPPTVEPPQGPPEQQSPIGDQLQSPLTDRSGQASVPLDRAGQAAHGPDRSGQAPVPSDRPLSPDRAAQTPLDGRPVSVQPVSGSAQVPIPMPGRAAAAMQASASQSAAAAAAQAAAAQAARGQVAPGQGAPGQAVSSQAVSSQGVSGQATARPVSVQPAPTQLGATHQPGATHPGATALPGAVNPGAVNPGAAHPGATHPGATHPDASQAGAVQAGAVQASTSPSPAAQPEVNRPVPHALSHDAATPTRLEPTGWATTPRTAASGSAAVPVSPSGGRRSRDDDAQDDNRTPAPRRAAGLDEAPEAPGGRRAARAGDDDESPLRPGDVNERSITFWEDAASEQFRAEWHEVKAQFVDDPVAALTRAHDLLTEAVNELTESMLAERDDLDPLRGTSTPDTESMRMAMRGYREFLDRILAL